MSKQKIIILLAIILHISACTTNSKKMGELSSNPATDSEVATEDSFEEDLEENTENEASGTAAAEEEAIDADLAQAEASVSDLNDQELSDSSSDSVASTTSEPVETSIVSDSSNPANITAVDFLANENGGSIVITADRNLEYSTRINPEKKQFILEVKNSKLADKFKRPYNTKEFKGAIGFFQPYQSFGSNTARFVIQLESDLEPLVQQDANKLMIIASNNNLDNSLSNMNEQEMNAMAGGNENFEPAIDSQSATADSKALQSKSLEEFLQGNNKFYGRKINIEVKDWDIRDVFDFIAEQSGLNLILTEDVRGSVSLKLREIPWDQALVMVMQSKQLGYIRQGNILRIAPLATLKTETDTARELINSQDLLQALKVRIFPISYANATELESQISEFLTPNRGKVKADKRSNTLVVTDMPKVLDKIANLLKELDRQPPQVLIEAKIVEAQDTFKRTIGMNWSAQPDAISPKFNTNDSGIIGGGSETFINANVGALKGWGNLQATLSLLEQENILKVLSAPKVVALNNQASTIEQSVEEPIKQIAVDNGVQTTTTQFKKISLKLSVTPQITAEGGVLLNLDLTREFLGALNDNGDRPINSRVAKTSLIVENGDTAVIGGIYRNEDSMAENRVPFFGSIPFLGWLFKNKAVTKDKNELMMFVTPQILNADKAFTLEKNIEADDGKKTDI